MHGFGDRLRERARRLGLSDAEVARRVGLGERRYAHYVADTREPDLLTLVRISETLGVTPNELLGVTDGHTAATERQQLIGELLAVTRPLSEDGLRIVIKQSAALIDHHRAEPPSE